MTAFAFGLVLLFASIAFFFIGSTFKVKAPIKNSISIFALIISIVLICISTAIKVESGQSGIVTKKFGTDLPSGSIVATKGEKGPQAKILPDGWHFGYWPWLYDLSSVENKMIKQGEIGVVTAMDGLPLPEGEIFANAWESPKEMLDAETFLTSGKGFKGPQLTVLPPGQWRYNPRLFTIVTSPSLEVPVGSVSVIKANAGNLADNTQVAETVNGVSIVPTGFRGIWKQALQPNAYYIHPQAYIVKTVKATKRIYSYTAKKESGAKSDRPTQDNAVTVKTKDGFEFPVDVRVSVKISAESAPYVVAMLGDPDADEDRDGFDTLEELVILPSIRSIFRNTAESKGALEYLNSRSIIEKEATSLFSQDMAKYKIDVDSVYIAQIGLTDTPEGKELIKTQTDRELANQQIKTFVEQQKAELERAKMVKAEEDANQEKFKAEAVAKVAIATSEADAKKALALGEAAAYKEKIAAFEGVEQYIRALAVERLVEVVPQIKLPNTLIIGGGSGSTNENLLTPILNGMLQQQQK